MAEVSPDEPTDRLRACLKQYWGYDDFRPLQEQAMRCVMEDRDSVVVLPTGGGKSLCYQVPALCREGLAVVVSPLISLMKDQVDALRECGVAAACVNSSLSASERMEVASAVRRGEIRVLYVAPERIVQERTKDFLEDSNLSFIAVDEAHCISEWGHDFRPEYRELKGLRERFPDVAFHAYTATATERVRSDIAENLGLKDHELLVGSFDRSNLFYRVERRRNRLLQIQKVLDRHQGESGIIYCISRRDVDELSETLNDLGYKTLPYHAGMDAEERQKNQEAFIQDRTETIVATVAFGMGIDKPNVRYVIHAGMPKALENYQQEAGRAGRDGLEAECCLFYSGSDAQLWRRILNEESAGNIDAAMASLEALDQFCTGVSCRHRSLVTYFGQDWPDEPCNACDVCVGDLDLLDNPLETAQKIVSGVVRLDQRFGGDYVSLHLTGSRDKRILENRHDQPSTYGILQQHDRRAVRDWLEQLVSQGYLEKVGEYRVIHVTAKGRELLRGAASPRLLQSRKRKSTAEASAEVRRESWDGVDRGLFERLRELRKELADERGVPAYIVFGDATLRELARQKPTSIEEIQEVKGVGEKKLRDYGDVFTQHIQAYLKNDTDPNRTAKAGVSKNTGRKISSASRRAWQFFRDGMTLAEVAETTGRASSTVTGYLCDFLQSEARTDPLPWVDADTFERVRTKATELQTDSSKQLFEALGETVSYDEIRISLTCVANELESCSQ
ncbi:DNA helicase RecQ [Thalassoroseus pseudoceratinae]|uniref:DNA helicase RecQ n=1 Tax=Thalassoroseus pseudoceratinae TaxID=2713176 RepID=UPI0014237F1C|nr:DNA helicase RecQ [Thalassoroseus pseudoceratinae]